jgi:hypothetical protein
MDWRLIACVVFLYKYGFVHVATKKIGAVEGSRTRKLVWQYFFAACIAVVVAAITGQLELSWPVVIVMVVGAGNAFGCYCQWRAYDISMSRTAMLSNFDDLVAIGLGYAFLGELQLLTPILTAGIVVSVVSVMVFAIAGRRDKLKDGKSVYQLIGWVLGYTLVWGISYFSMRFFSLQGISIPTYVAAFYVGSLLGALFTRFVIMGKKEEGEPLKPRQLAKVLLLAVGILTALMLSYWMRAFVPITVIQPIQLVAGMSIPALIGMIFFKEIHNMSRQEIVTIGFGLVGVAIIAISAI